MEIAAARELIWFESCEVGGIVVSLRMGEDPGPERMQGVLHALRCVFEGLRGAVLIERRLAYALYALAVYSESQVESWAKQGRVWRDELLAEEIPNLIMAVESIFSGEWSEL